MTNTKRKYYLLIIVSVMLISTVRMSGQTNNTIDSLAKVTTWISTDQVKYLKDIMQRQEINAKHEISIAQRDSLKKELEKSIRKRDILSNEQDELRSSLSSIYKNGERYENSRRYLRCDTAILLLHRGLYGDTFVENMQEALLACRRAESILSVRYDEESVSRVREGLKRVKNVLPKDYAEIDRRLEQYGKMTDNLRKALSAADNLDRRNRVEKNLASDSKIRYARRFFEKLSDSLDSVLLVPNEYPYLYGILNKAMEIIMDDPRKEITDLINKL